ncbi:MAG TPA: aldehyde dehydrogenase family protein, partial [Chroococcidiopsis sp.]
MTSLVIEPTQIRAVIQQQRDYFNAGQTRDIATRLRCLQALRRSLLAHETELLAALHADLHKPAFEGYAYDLGCLKEIDHAIAHLRRWAKPKWIVPSWEQWPALGQIRPEPRGVVLIVAPWNYPILLSITPLVGAIAAGNCAIIKPSELAPATGRVLAELIRKTFDPGHVTVIEGDIATSQALLAEPWDHIFFTGGTATGKQVMAAAAAHLTPVTLELGGKSPCIVDADVDVAIAAKRIVWGKFLNAGQSCVAPDYLLVDRRIKPALIEAIATTIRQFYGDDPAHSPDYARIVSDRQMARLTALLQDGTVIIGGQTQIGDRYIAPTVIDDVALDAPIMQDEIFGPLLPV